MNRIITSRLARRVIAGAVIAGATIAGPLLAAGTASAQSGYETFNAGNSLMAMDVSGSATYAGAPVIQWFDNGGHNQHWSIPDPGDTGPVINQHSGMCLYTPGIAGAGLVQEPCEGWAGEEWTVSEEWGLFGDVIVLRNPNYNLVADVYGDSLRAGSEIDAWYFNGNLNQQFYEDSAN
ncbi:MAG: RICIN domain-containing protein [Acidimicrobiaceae bacterium]|nr:RICIN domain-containing protein [Acidimicrobiaceae bacterium]